MANERETLLECYKCRRIEVSPGFWLGEENNPNQYFRIIKDHKTDVIFALCPEDLEKWRKVYGR